MGVVWVLYGCCLGVVWVCVVWVLSGCRVGVRRVAVWVLCGCASSRELV